VFDLKTSLDSDWPTRSYCSRLMDSLGQSTDAMGPFLQVNTISRLVYASKMAVMVKTYSVSHQHVTVYLCILPAEYSQLPKRRGQVWPSIGKSISCIGQSPLIVNLSERHLKNKVEIIRYIPVYWALNRAEMELFMFISYPVEITSSD